MTTHKLKSWPASFRALRRGEKTFEIRENDRDYKVGDLLVLQEFVPLPLTGSMTVGHPDGHYTNNQEVRWITYVMASDGSGVFGLADGFVILGLRNHHGSQWTPEELDRFGVQSTQLGARPIVTVGDTSTRVGMEPPKPPRLDGRPTREEIERDFKPYVPASKPLTAHERELLTILNEECLEVGIQISKLLRFGRVAVDRSVTPNVKYDNIAMLGMEIGNLQHMINVAQACELVWPESIKAGEHDKQDKLGRYLQTRRAPSFKDLPDYGAAPDPSEVHEGQG